MSPGDPLAAGRFLAKWIVLGAVVGVLAGSASALFLVALAWATATREAQPWLVWLLPPGGLLVGLLYHGAGKDVEGGNNLILDEIHEPKAGVPLKIAPLVLVATVGTHLFGGSAGREGTAVQMGGGIASWLGRVLRLDPRLLLMAGMSGGFGAVFGTPLAGLVFGLEVLALGRLKHDGLIPCLAASVAGDWTCHAWGVGHAHYRVAVVPATSPALVAVVLLAAVAFAAVAVAFVEATHAVTALFKRIEWPPLRPVVGGAVLIVLSLVSGRAYLGLGLPLIAATFEPGGVPSFAFAWKVGLTALTLGSGFKGGEVTPLFFIGSTLGCTLGHLTGVDPPFLAALGFVAVFAAAAKTPLACIVMGIELFGASLGVWLAVACGVAYVASGPRGIYAGQRRGRNAE